MKRLTSLFLTAIFALSLNIMSDGSMLSDVSAANKKPQVTSAQKAQQKRKEQQKKDAAKAKKAREAEKAKKQKAAQKAAKKTAKSKPSVSQEQAYQSKVESIQAHNQKVTAYMNRDIAHQIGVWGQVGYSSMFQNFTSPFSAKSLGDVGGGAGIGYMLRYKHFLFNTGVEYQQYNSYTSILGSTGEPLQRSFSVLEYPSMQYTYQFDKMIDHWTASYIQLPVLFGGEWGDVFFLAGAKVGINVLGKSFNRSDFTTIAQDFQLTDPLTGMATHQLQSAYVQMPTAEPLKFGLNAALSAEVGLNLDKWLQFEAKKSSDNKKAKKKNSSQMPNWHYKLSLFAEYGVLNIQSLSNASGATYDLPAILPPDGTNLLQFPLVSALNTPASASARVNPFLVGVKMAVYCELPRKQKKLLPMPQEPLPRLAIRVVNTETQTPVGGAMVTIANTTKGTKFAKTTNSNGLAVGKYSKGSYEIFAEKEGFFASQTTQYNHQRDLADTIILSMRPEPKPIEYFLCGYVLDAETNMPLEEAQVQIMSNEGNRLYQGTTADDGLFVTRLRDGNYMAHITMVGYLPLDNDFTFAQDTLKFAMQRIKEGKKVKINNLYFATGKTVILPESESALTDLADFLSENPNVKIRIIGHTDNVGSAAFNQSLSEGRANAVRQNLIMRNIDASRIEAEGRGMNEPVATNETEEGRQQNRRVEFEIIKNE